MGTQRSAFHVAPRVFATIDGDSIALTGDKGFNSEIVQAIKEAIMKILKEKAKNIDQL